MTQKDINSIDKRTDHDDNAIFMAVMVYIDLFSTCNSLALMSWNYKSFGFVGAATFFHNATLLSFFLQLNLIRNSLSFGRCIEIIVWGSALFAGPVATPDRSKILLLLCLVRSMWHVRSAIDIVVKRGEAKTADLKRDIRLSEDSLKDIKTAMTGIKHLSQTETDLRKRSERVLQSYKDELETVNEALRIAAMEHNSAVLTLKGDKEKKDETEYAASKRVVVHLDGSFDVR